MVSKWRGFFGRNIQLRPTFWVFSFHFFYIFDRPRFSHKVILPLFALPHITPIKKFGLEIFFKSSFFTPPKPLLGICSARAKTKQTIKLFHIPRPWYWTCSCFCHYSRYVCVSTLREEKSHRDSSLKNLPRKKEFWEKRCRAFLPKYRLFSSRLAE